MRTLLSTSALVLAALLLASLANAVAKPGGKVSVGDLDEPVTAYQARAIDNNDPPVPEDNTPPGEPEPPPPEVFGEPVPGKRILFILDHSCSMRSGNAMNRLKDELKAAIDALVLNNEQLQALWEQNGQVGDRPKVEFTMIKFNSSARRWNKQLVEATMPNGRAAKQWVDGLRPRGGTSWSRALKSAFKLRLEFDSIFFQSDGYPNTANPWHPWADKLAQQHYGAENQLRFIAQFFATSYYGHSSSGNREMRRLSDRMDGKPNVTGVFSSVS